MTSTSRILAVCLVLAGLGAPAVASAQINFEKTGYYLSLGDSIAAGEGALPVTHGFVYQLYHRGVFGKMQEMDFGNIAIKGATADEVQLLQIPEALCIQPPRIAVAPSVITLSAGANDFLVYFALNGIPADIPGLADGIAVKVANIIRSLVFGMPGLPVYCAGSGIPGIVVLVSNYYSFDHPDPQIDVLLDLALQSFGAKLADEIASIQGQIDTAGMTARVAYVDTFSAMDGRQGLLLIQKLNGFMGGFDFEIHPTNAGHTLIAHEFERVWNDLE